MGFFDFLKRRELQKIKDLEEQLSRYRAISDIDKEVSERKVLLQKMVADTEKEIADRQSVMEDYVNKREADLQKMVAYTESEIMDRKLKMEQEASKREANLDKQIVDLEGRIHQKKSQLESISNEYDSSLALYKKLKNEIGVYETKLDIIEYGMYEPVYDFERSDEYRLEQERIMSEQKWMIQEDTAAICNTVWTVAGSEAQGRATVKRYKKLMLRAFNGECDALIAKVKWNNVMQMQERMSKLFTAINKLGENFQVEIVPEYKLLKQKELILEYEYQAKRQKEKEEMRAVQEELREEEKARREFEQAQRAAEKEEQNYQKALEKAMKDVEEATGAKQIRLQAQIELLEQQLAKAQEQKQRAISMAQQTKRGHVYIISNIGSFGDDVYKIGMTRRLEPIDRVKELGDASVPFQFDIHAMIYCEDAPSLENALHKAFTNKKVNMLNYRKEFFNVSMDDIESKLKEIGIAAELTRLPEAMEYRETKAILEKLRSQKSLVVSEEIIVDFPESIKNYELEVE